MKLRAQSGRSATLLFGCAGLLCMGMALPGPACSQTAQATATAARVQLDRVVATVNNQAILASDIDAEIRLSVLDPSRAETDVLTPARALDLLISRALIKEQMQREDFESAAPSDEEVAVRLKELRSELPVCASRCATDSDWARFLAAHALTAERVAEYLRNRIAILSFIERRFRQGIRVAPEEIEVYYRKTLLPQFAAGTVVPPLEKVAPRIEEILLQQRVNEMFDGWLKDLRRQGDVEVLDPALESTDQTAAAKGGTF